METLVKNPHALCAGSSELYIYFKHISKMYQSGPFGPTHATAGTFAFRRELLNFTRYEEEACLGEERAFLKQYTVPFVQLDPMKTILVFSHNHNTFDKKNMLNNEHPDFFKDRKRSSSALSTRIPLVHVQTIFTPVEEIASQTFFAHL